MSGQKNGQNRGRNPPSNLDGCNTLSSPQYMGPYLVTNTLEGNLQLGSPSVLNPKEHNTQAHPRNIASRPTSNIQKGKLGKGRPQVDGTRPVASRPEVTSPKPQLEHHEVFDPKGLQPLVYPQKIRTPEPSPTALRLAGYLLRAVNQERPALSRRSSTGELPVRDKLANKFVMSIPKQRFGIGGRRDSTASVPPGMTAESCNDPYRTAIRERLAAGEPRVPPRSEFAKDSKNYHAAGKVSASMSTLHESEELDLMKQATALIAWKAYKNLKDTISVGQRCGSAGLDTMNMFLSSGMAKQLRILRKPQPNSSEQHYESQD
ncbi:uncharacterized protein NECHADRAFT_77530 [Fusarium vanettenii 77-13-4]|uniref:Uncharacterized protein n=1 Tax=Fusarium vanettenii (strain ATCC MYA-4622 / CBS 123669 / FGSC 9596 / NRRL 45880 / 77-13-4) TaxID=660122 RepID=C7YLH2_FUSV7|nr:uncharacterized protein NECHADRAFT_77530 [Fusarium vanettenii 77-13-4]EEU46785.1 predicted protein [Fusarium vanettenii 77-13-4]